jgi:hypothetical protein
MVKTLLLLSFMLSAVSHTFAQQGQKFIIDSEDLAHPLSFKELSRPSPFAVSITRHFSNEKEEQLLRIAEATYPAREDVLKNCQRAIKSGEKDVKDSRLWWCFEADGARLPFAITKSAVAYYIDLSESLRKGETKSMWQRYTTFSYDADISHQENYRISETTFRDVYIVTMRLFWKETCGDVPDMCSFILDKSRKVGLDKNGSVLAIEGDGMPMPLFS